MSGGMPKEKAPADDRKQPNITPSDPQGNAQAVSPVASKKGKGVAALGTKSLKSAAQSGTPSPGTRSSPQSITAMRASGDQAVSWLEGADLTPKALLTQTVDIAGLAQVIQKLTVAVIANAKAQAQCRADCDRVVAAIEDDKRRSFADEARRQVLDDAVTKAQSEIKTIQKEMVDITEFSTHKARIQDHVSNLNARCDLLQAKKLDASDPQLERDARKHALDTVKEVSQGQTREIRQWVDRRLEALGQTLRKEDNLMFDRATTAVDKSVQELQSRIEQTTNSISEQVTSQFEMVKDGEYRVARLMDKVREHERESDELLKDAFSDTASVRREVRALLKGLGVSPEELAKILHSGWDAEEESDVKRRREREMVSIVRDERRLSLWRTVHSIQNAKAYQPSELNLWKKLDEDFSGQLTQRRAEQEIVHGNAIRECRRRVEQMQAKSQEERNKQMGEWAAWSGDDAVRLFMRLPVFVDMRETLEEATERRVAAAREDITDDLSQQILAQGKDMKTKINATRCVELISEHTGKITEDSRLISARLDELNATKVDLDACHAMMREKTDVSSTEKKMDRTTATDMFEFMNSKIDDLARASDSAKLVRELSSRLDDLRSGKLDRDDPEWLAVLGVVSAGGMAAQQGERPAVPHLPAFLPHGQSNNARGASPPFIGPPPVRATGQRLMDSGSQRLVESGSQRLMETSFGHRAFTPQPPQSGVGGTPATASTAMYTGATVTVEDMVTRRSAEESVRRYQSAGRELQKAAVQDVRRQREKRRLGAEEELSEIRDILGQLSGDADTEVSCRTGEGESTPPAGHAPRPQTSLARRGSA